MKRFHRTKTCLSCLLAAILITVLVPAQFLFADELTGVPDTEEMTNLSSEMTGPDTVDLPGGPAAAEGTGSAATEETGPEDVQDGTPAEEAALTERPGPAGPEETDPADIPDAAAADAPVLADAADPAVPVETDPADIPDAAAADAPVLADAADPAAPVETVPADIPDAAAADAPVLADTADPAAPVETAFTAAANAEAANAAVSQNMAASDTAIPAVPEGTVSADPVLEDIPGTSSAPAASASAASSGERIPLKNAALKYSSLVYTGSPRTQSGTVSVTANVNGTEQVLTRGTDYIVCYENNTNAGTATAIIRGKGRFTGELRRSFAIAPAAIRSVELKYDQLVYNGSARTQSGEAVVTAVTGGKRVVLTRGTDYTIRYENNTGIGTAVLITKGKGNYTGTIRRTFRIIPQKPVLLSLTTGNRYMKISWRAPSGPYSGFKVQYSTKSDFSSGIKNISVTDPDTTGLTLSGLLPGKTYYVRVRAYYRGSNTYYSDWSTRSASLPVNVLRVKKPANGTRTLILENVGSKVQNIRFAVWSETNGQDDLVWYPARKRADGRWVATFEASNHRNDGAFRIQAYTGTTPLSASTFKTSAAETETEASKAAASLKAAKQTDQLILVAAVGTGCTLTMLNKNSDGTWHELLSTDGYVGLNGIGDVTEWNRKTPVGVYGFSAAFGIFEDPGTVLDYIRVDDTYYWVDDVDSAYYNQFVTTRTTVPDWNSAEHIIDYTNAYQYCLALDFNRDCIPGAGSAIFLHVDSGGPTLGCIAVPLEEMEAIMQYVREGCRIIIDTPEGLKTY